MNPLFENHRIFLVGGPGGVGKTTLSAALAVALTQAGHDTLVLTVDPAKRLAQALGLDTLGHELVSIPRSGQATLWASQLNSERFLDQLIHKIAVSPEQADKIINNSIFQTMSAGIGGTHEYAAMERVLEFAFQDRFTKIVVDTPPAQNAIDLITAPKRMFDFMDNSIVHWFAGHRSFMSGIFHHGTHLAFKALHHIFGTDFFESFENFMKDIEGLQDGFRRRNQQVMHILRSATTAFCLTTIGTEQRFNETLTLQDFLREERIPLKAIWLNQMEPQPPDIPRAVLSSDPALRIWSRYCHDLAGCHAQWRRQFENLSVPVFPIARRVAPPASWQALLTLGKELVH